MLIKVKLNKFILSLKLENYFYFKYLNYKLFSKIKF